MNVIGDDGSVLDATFSIEQSPLSVVYESAGGRTGVNPRNRDYARGLSLVLRRLGEGHATVTDLEVDSIVTRRLRAAQRRIALRRYRLPIQMADVGNIEDLRRDISSAAREPGARESASRGGSSRRLRILLSHVREQPSQLERRLAGIRSELGLADLSDPRAVLDAIAEFDQAGRDAFLLKYGFRPSRRYFLHHKGKEYDSKAIVGAAHGFQHPERGPLRWDDFSGGEQTVQPKLESLGFKVIVKDSHHYWWIGIPTEKYWIEIRHIAGLGSELRCPILDESGQHNPWYDLVAAVSPGDEVFHWHARQSRFVGRSVVADDARSIGGEWVVPLTRFVPLVGDVDLVYVRAHESEARAIQGSLSRKHPGDTLYLPFQFRRDGLRMMSNYFTKLPAELARRLFGASGLADQGAADPPVHDADSDPDQGPVAGRYLEPFRPKADSDYIAHVVGGPHKRGRHHETLVNDFNAWLRAQGLQPGRNRAIDIGFEEPPVVIEAEVVTSWPASVREAVGQLYEYRFFKVANPASSLLFLASKPVPERWRNYLEDDRGIAVAWQDDNQFVLSTLASQTLGVK